MRQTVSPAVWDALVSENARANIFHERRFIDCFSHSAKYVPFAVFFERGETPLGAIIGLQTRMLGPHLQRLTSRAVVYGGVLLSPRVTDRHIDRDLGEMIELYDEWMGDSTLFTEVRNVSDATSLLLPLAQHGYKFEPHLNYLVDLSSGEKSVWSNFSKVVRKKVRRGRERLRVFEVTGERGLESFYELVRTTYSRVHVPFFERNVFRCVFRRLRTLGFVRVTMAVQDDEPVAARAALTYRGRVFDWFAGSDERGDACDASTLLVWDMMEWGCRNGYRLFDFGGAGDPHHRYGVREFKSRFHGRPVNYGRFTRVYSRSRYLVSSTGYSVARRVLF
jgi:hypothetical protein